MSGSPQITKRKNALRKHTHHMPMLVAWLARVAFSGIETATNWIFGLSTDGLPAFGCLAVVLDVSQPEWTSSICHFCWSRCANQLPSNPL